MESSDHGFVQFTCDPVQAPTGAGKTTIVPLALLEGGHVDGKAQQPELKKHHKSRHFNMI